MKVQEHYPQISFKYLFTDLFYENEELQGYKIRQIFNNLKRKNKFLSMNFPNTIKSPRASLQTPSINSQLGQVGALQQAMLEKDQTISNLQGQINKLELKNKECSSYQQAMIEYEARAEQLQNQLLKTNEKLRAKLSECDQLKKKLDIQLKEKKDRASSFVRHQDYMKLSNDYKKFRQVHRNCDHSIKAIQKQMQQKVGAATSQLSQLKQQINSLNNIIETKNSQINELKLQKYNIKSNQSIESHKDLNPNANSNLNINLNAKSNTNIISSFRIIGEENSSIKENGETQKINYELLTYSRQNDELRKKVQKLEQQLQQYLKSSVEWSAQQKNKQYSQIIEEYEANMSNMANKLGAVHRLEMEKNSLEQQRRKYQVQCQQLRQQIASRISYCESLQKKLRQIQHYKSAYLQTDLQNYILKNEKLNRQVERLQKSVNEKYEQIVELKKAFMNVQITQQTFRLMELSVNNLEQSLTASQNQLRKQQDKMLQKEESYFKLQKQMKGMEIQMSEVKSEMAKMNRVVSQKVQKIEFQSTEIKRLEKENAEKTDLSKRLASLEIENKKLEKQYQEQLDQSNELAMAYIVLSAEIERRQISGNITKQFMIEFQNLKVKAKQTQNYARNLEQKVKRLQHLHKQVVGESIKISEHLHMSHKRWNHYDTAMQRLINYLQQQDERSNQKYEQLDSNINTWLTLQEQRLKQLAKNDPLGEDDSPYVKYTAKITTQPLVLESAIPKSVNS